MTPEPSHPGNAVLGESDRKGGRALDPTAHRPPAGEARLGDTLACIDFTTPGERVTAFSVGRQSQVLPAERGTYPSAHSYWWQCRDQNPGLQHPALSSSSVRTSGNPRRDPRCSQGADILVHLWLKMQPQPDHRQRQKPTQPLCGHNRQSQRPRVLQAPSTQVSPVPWLQAESAPQ